jgi:hypothetical protein
VRREVHVGGVGWRNGSDGDYEEAPVTPPESGMFLKGEKELIRHMQKTSRAALDPDQQPDVDTEPRVSWRLQDLDPATG